jgi:hypothetical protein
MRVEVTTRCRTQTATVLGRSGCMSSLVTQLHMSSAVAQDRCVCCFDLLGAAYHQINQRVPAPSTHTHAHTYAHTRTHTHTHAHTHTHTHTHTHILTLARTPRHALRPTNRSFTDEDSAERAALALRFSVFEGGTLDCITGSVRQLLTMRARARVCVCVCVCVTRQQPPPQGQYLPFMWMFDPTALSKCLRAQRTSPCLHVC